MNRIELKRRTSATSALAGLALLGRYFWTRNPTPGVMAAVAAFNLVMTLPWML